MRLLKIEKRLERIGNALFTTFVAQLRERKGNRMTSATQDNMPLVPRVVLDAEDIITSSLAFVRSHLSMEIAYLSEFVNDNLVFRAINAPGFEDIVKIGDQIPLTQAFCPHILEGRLPELIPDTARVPFLKDTQIDPPFPIRSHVSIPIRRFNGDVYGMYCCLSSKPRPSLNNRDLEVMRAFASLSADQVNSKLMADTIAQMKREAIEEILDETAFEIALQPITRLKDNGVAGYEALCRFSSQPYRAPNLWFDDAAEVGLQADLELHVIDQALKLLPDLPQGCYLAVNTSPATLASGKIGPLARAAGGARVIIEITEHDAIEDLDMLLHEIDRLRECGARIAIDDAGAGYSGLQQIVRIRPDVIKLDMSLTQDIDKDLARRSLASAMVQFARDTNAHVVAEGIETEAEMRTLRQLGVEMGQGYHLGRPELVSDMMGRSKYA